MISLTMLKIFHKQFNMQKLTVDILHQVFVQKLLSKSVELSYNN